MFTSVPRCYKGLVLDFRVLGPLEVSSETGPLLLGGQKQRALLSLLLPELLRYDGRAGLARKRAEEEARAAALEE